MILRAHLAGKEPLEAPHSAQFFGCGPITPVQSSELEAEAPLTEDAPEVVNSTLSVESELLRETPPVEDEFLFDSMSPTD